MSWILSSNLIFHFLIALFYTSVTGGVATLCVILLHLFLRKRDYIKICYRMLCGSLLLFFIPVTYIFAVYLDRAHDKWHGLLFLQTPLISKILPWIIITWIIGFLTTLTLQLIPAFILYKHKKHLIPCETHIQTFFNRLCISINIPYHNIQLFHSYATSVPFCLHMFHPVIILPIQDYTDENLQIILTHELTHIRNKDIWFKYFSILMKSVHFFNPCIWILSSLLEHWSEYVCDNETIKHLGCSKQYFITILEYTTANQHQPRIMSALGYNSLTTKQRLTRYSYYKKQATGSLVHLLPRLIPTITLSWIIIFGSVFLLTNVYEKVYNATFEEEIENPSFEEYITLVQSPIKAEHTITAEFVQNNESIPLYMIEFDIESAVLFRSQTIFMESGELISLGILATSEDSSFLIGLEHPNGTHLSTKCDFRFDSNISITESGYYRILIKNLGDETARVGCIISIE